MSERLTMDWALYEIASDIEQYEHWLNVRFSIEEKRSLQEYLQIYEKHLDVRGQLLKLKDMHPQTNAVSKAFNDLKILDEVYDKEIQRLVETAPLQNVLSYRFDSESPKKKNMTKKRKSTIKEKLADTLGYWGIILYYIVRIIVCILPFVMIGGGFFFGLLLIAINYFIPFTSVLFWVWGLFCAIKGVQDIWAIIYYVVFAVVWLPFYISLLSSFFSRD